LCENGVARCPIEEEDPEYVELVNGVLRPGLKVTMCDTCVDQIRTGYRCINCSLRSKEGFPETCEWCGYGMRFNQARDFEDLYAGWVDTKSQIDWDAEYENLERRRYERELAQGLRSKGVVLPRGL
jgi:RNase P subunit RPR2